MIFPLRSPNTKTKAARTNCERYEEDAGAEHGLIELAVYGGAVGGDVERQPPRVGDDEIGGDDRDEDKHHRKKLAQVGAPASRFHQLEAKRGGSWRATPAQHQRNSDRTTFSVRQGLE